MANFSVRLVKELKGAPLSVLMALLFAGEVPVNLAWLARNTGYTDKPVRQALAYLCEHGFVLRAGRGWKIGGKSAQLLLSASDQAEIAEAEAASQGCADPADTPGGRDGKCRKNSGQPIIIVEDLKESTDSENTNSERGKNSRISGGFADFPELGQALMDVGIMENARTRGLLGRITPRDVRAMAAKIRDDPFHDLSETGLMVTILEGMAERNERRGGYEGWNW
jgi:hypothetical protein